MKYILEYDEADIRDLMGDLKTVGHAKEYGGTLWARFRNYRLGDNRWTQNPEYVCFLKTNPIYGTGDEDKDKALMLQAIQNGDFARPEDPDARSWAALKSGNSTVVDFLEKSNIQSLAKTCSTMDELIEQIRENLVRAQKLVLKGSINRTTYPYREMEDHEIQETIEGASSVLVYGFFAPLESTYLATSNPYTPDTPAKAMTIRYKPFEKVDDINYFKD